MAEYIRTPYGHFPRLCHIARFPDTWDAEEAWYVSQ